MKKLFLLLVFVLMSTFLTADDKPSGANSAAAAVAPPAAKKIHTENHINGGNLVDDLARGGVDVVEGLARGGRHIFAIDEGLAAVGEAGGLRLEVLEGQCG